jgi:hypothetical protein
MAVPGMVLVLLASFVAILIAICGGSPEMLVIPIIMWIGGIALAIIGFTVEMGFAEARFNLVCLEYELTCAMIAATAKEEEGEKE